MPTTGEQMSALWLVLTMEYLLAMNESTDTPNTHVNMLQNIEHKKKIPENCI